MRPTFNKEKAEKLAEHAAQLAAFLADKKNRIKEIPFGLGTLREGAVISKPSPQKRIDRARIAEAARRRGDDNG